MGSCGRSDASARQAGFLFVRQGLRSIRYMRRARTGRPCVDHAQVRPVEVDLVRMPDSLVSFIVCRVRYAYCTVRANGVKYRIYATRGMRFVMYRAVNQKRPWLVVRDTVLTCFWDVATFAAREDHAMAFLRKLQRPAQGALDKPDPVDPEISSKFPALHEHLTRSVDDEGKRRQTCSLTLYGASGGFRAFLNDRDSGASLGVVSDSIQGLLRALEAELESDAPNWYWREGAQGQGGGKRGKRS